MKRMMENLAPMVMVALTVGLIIVGSTTAVSEQGNGEDTGPDQMGFFKKARQSEAKTNLGAMFTVQVAYFGEYNTYSGGENCFANGGWSPEGDTRYSYYCGDDVIYCTKPGCDLCSGADIEPEVSQTGFTVYAVGNIDRDSVCDVWTMNDTKMMVNVVNDDKKWR